MASASVQTPNTTSRSRQNLPAPAQLHAERHFPVEFNWERLREDSSIVFSTDQIRFESIKVDRTDSVAEEKVVSNIELFEVFCRESLSYSDNDTYIFIRQNHSWGHLQITFDAFKRLLNIYNVSSHFLYYVQSFGAKIIDVDSSVGGYWAHERYDFEGVANGNARIISNDFCYLLRYPEKNGRNPSNPWSIRQLAVCQTYNYRTNASSWIFLQFPRSLQKLFLDFAMTNGNGSFSTSGPDLNLGQLEFVLSTSTSKWRDYINFLEAEINMLNEKACYSRVERTEHDYLVGFSDAQTLQGIRRKLFKSIEAIDEALDITTGLQKHRRKLIDCGLSTSAERLQLELYYNRLQNYRRNLIALADFQQGASTLFLKMLDHRNDHVVHQHGKGLNQLAVQTSRESTVMKELSEKMQKDSRSMRILTSVALVYLPASLVAAIFNSNLLQLVPPDTPSIDTNHFVMASQIWLFPLSTLCLTAITLAGVISWSKWTERSESRRTP